MIIERMEFRLKFGKAKEAVAIWKQVCEIFKNTKDHSHMRVATDLTGQSYTLIVEIELRNLIDMGFKAYQWMTIEDIRKLYSEFIPLCESSHRTLYNVECEI